MKIYTKTGDDGNTMRPDQSVVRKTDPFAEAVGTVDELNAHLGLAIAAADACPPVAESLTDVQEHLLGVGAILATAGTGKQPFSGINGKDIASLEKAIDAHWSSLPPLRHFILPGGCELAARLHVARTVARRAERRVVGMTDAGTNLDPAVLKYLNRLSDLLFVLARVANAHQGRGDAVWDPTAGP
ncbi:MAG: cob(I)yrinic acid a,c-diamide adenosyltransferase [Phycisphaerae bacterium]